MVAGTSPQTSPLYTIRKAGMLRGAGGRFGAAPVLVFRDRQYVQTFRTEKAAQRFIAAQSEQEVK